MTKAMIFTLLAVGIAACAPRRVSEEPIIDDGDRVRYPEDVVADTRERVNEDHAETVDERDRTTAEALADCRGAVCDALARGEVALGMSEAQVLAATRTTEEAWSTRESGRATVMVPYSASTAPDDAVGELTMVVLREGEVSEYSYREAHGIRLVSGPADTTTAGRAHQLADMLVREGDDLAARGDFEGALNRYDRAAVLWPTDPLLDYRIATILDRQRRPLEALARYQLFLHRLEIEKIEAVGEAYAGLADAIAHARERIIILEKQGS